MRSLGKSQERVLFKTRKCVSVKEYPLRTGVGRKNVIYKKKRDAMLNYNAKHQFFAQKQPPGDLSNAKRDDMQAHSSPHTSHELLKANL